MARLGKARHNSPAWRSAAVLGVAWSGNARHSSKAGWGRAKQGGAEPGGARLGGARQGKA